MNVGRTLGYVLLSLVDALLPSVFVLALGILFVPVDLVDDLLAHLFAFAGLSFVCALIAALICVRRGGKPFPVTRGTRAVAEWLIKRFWYWPP